MTEPKLGIVQHLSSAAARYDYREGRPALAISAPDGETLMLSRRLRTFDMLAVAIGVANGAHEDAVPLRLRKRNETGLHRIGTRLPGRGLVLRRGRAIAGGQPKPGRSRNDSEDLAHHALHFRTHNERRCERLRHKAVSTSVR